MTSFNSLHYYFRHSANKIKGLDAVYLIEKRKENWEEITYREVLRQVNAISAYFMELGYDKQDKVALIIENCPEYICFDQALMQLGLVNVSIYPTLSEAEIEYIINNSESKAILIGTPFLWRKVSKIMSNCSELKLLITAFDQSKQTEGTISYAKMIELGEALYEKHKEAIEKRLESVSRQDLSCLLYTSGTTGKPKGAMLTHNNFITNVDMAIQLMPIVNKDYRFLSFLPMCHVYERTATYYLSTIVGAEVAFAQSLEALSGNIIEMKPTAILTVPRLLERIEEKVRKNVTQKGGFSLKIFNWSFVQGEQRRLLKEAGKSPGLMLSIKLAIAEKLVFSKIKARLGGNMKIMISGGGAMPKHVGEFFANMGVRVCEGYGLTETSPLVCVNEAERQIFGTVGRIGNVCEVAIQNPETKEIYTVQSYQTFNPTFESAEGEILVRGENVMKGYWKMPEATAEAIDKDGWLHTGDVGKFHKGYLKITDRIKNIIVNSFGKNVYPTPIENTYLKSSKIEQIFLIGDKQEYLTAIVVPSKEEMKEVFGFNEQYFEQQEVFITDEQVVRWIEEDMKLYEKELGKFERVKHFIVKRKPFSLEEGELTPTQKAKRKVIEQKYAPQIEEMYSLTVI
ncbi:MAG: long-chain fatty acid--CoA ligase [Bacteroidia bacterium]|jgi:long-chain acyl-CoA synthetase|nr:long-chain fatty acid--CoA ligase [Bacteroidia bacterium]